MPNPADTQAKPISLHTVRVEDDLWSAALAEAHQRDESVSAVIRRALRAYTAPVPELEEEDA